MLLPIILGGCTSQSSSSTSYFQQLLVEPLISSIHGIAMMFGGNFGVAIILITLLTRVIIMPLVLKQYRTQQAMKGKMETLKPEMEEIQKKLKAAKNQQEQQKLQQEMLGLYRKHNVNPFAMGCLPMLLQMPILMGLYYAIRTSEEIATHSFLWFNLGQPDILITAAAGIVYYMQFQVTQTALPDQQKNQMKYLGFLSPAMIVFFSLNAPSALPLYWTVGGLFLIAQTLLARRMYNKDNSVDIKEYEKEV